MTYQDFFGGKKITLMGLGVLGRAVGDAEFLAQCGAELLITDMKSESELRESVVKLSMYPDITFRLGGHIEDDFRHCDMVIKGAGVPLDSPYIKAARGAGIPVYMSTALFTKFAEEEGAKVIGVTGTRGKSTITYMIHHALATAGRKATFGGNIRGVSTLALIPHVRSGDFAVLELDSWQLQGFGDLQISPHIAVLSNLMEDHMNYYPDMDRYFTDKANIFMNQKVGDYLFVGQSVSERVHAANPPVAAVVPQAIPSDWQLQVPGQHNRDNAALAAAALRAAGLNDEEIRIGLETFYSIEGRLQLVGEKNGIKIYNDNNSTTPHATIAALRAVGTSKKNIILIIGGDDKNLDMTELLEEIPKFCRAVVLFKERGTDRIRDVVFEMKKQGIEVYEESSLPPTVGQALKIAKSGDIVLYSPAFTSFGKHFRNEFHRGDQFMALVRGFLAMPDPGKK